MHRVAIKLALEWLVQYCLQRAVLKSPAGSANVLRRKLVHRVRCGLQLKRNGKPYKELVKIAHPPIIRRSEPFVMQNHVQ